MTDSLIEIAMEAWEAGDLPRAEELLIEAADAGNGHAAHYLGTLYAEGGPGVKADPMKSRTFYEQALASGFDETIASDPIRFREETCRVLPMVPEAEFYTAEGCYINELSNSDADPEASIARARVPAGVTTRWHRLAGTTERYVILSGLGRVEVGRLAARTVGPGDVVLIPPGCRQRIANLGKDDVVFLAICTPRFRPEAYEDIDPGPLPTNPPAET
jgi:mannose-6-phosphate isomerase-like protein (cupin superfamily)